jgi:hypothetical protein
MPGPYRPPVPAPPVPGPPPGHPPTPVSGSDGGGSGTGHPAVDAVIQSLANAANVPLRDQIAEYEAAHRTLQETLASIDQG